MANQTTTLSIEYKVDFKNGNRKREVGKRSAAPKVICQKIPRITKLLALAHHLQDLLDRGVVKDYADIACLSGLSRARVTQIMNLVLLSPQIQEEMLFPTKAISEIKEQAVRNILKNPAWKEQAREWKKIKSTLT